MELLGISKIYQNSAWRKDATPMINLYDKHAVLFDMWDQGDIPNASEWRKSIQKWLSSLGEEKVKAEFEMVKTHEEGTT